jgi:hypothetical protein
MLQVRKREGSPRSSKLIDQTASTSLVFPSEVGTRRERHGRLGRSTGQWEGQAIFTEHVFVSFDPQVVHTKGRVKVSGCSRCIFDAATQRCIPIAFNLGQVDI